MNKYIFIGVLFVLFTIEILQPVQTNIILPFTQNLATLSAFFMQLFDSQIMARSDVISSFDGKTAVRIQAGCNGIEAMICFTAAILAYSSTAWEKFIGLLVGYLAIQGLNIFRIISLFYLLQWNYDWFEWAHLYLWQALIFLDVLIVFVVWVRWLPSCKNQAPPTENLAHA